MTTVYYDLSSGDFTQDWSNTGLITTNDDWSGVPSIVGYSTGDVTNATGVNPSTVLTDAGFNPRVVANASATSISGAVIEVQGDNPTIAFQGANASDYQAIALYMNALGREHVTFSCNIRDLDGGSDNATQQVSVQYRIGSTGNWTDLPSAYIADATTAGSATQVTPVLVELPESAWNQAELQIRVVTTNAAGNDELIGVDDIRVTSLPAGSGEPDPVPGSLSIADASVIEQDSGSQDLTFTVTRSDGSDGAVSATWTVTFDGVGAADAGDFAAGTVFTGTVDFADGATSATITLPVLGDTDVEPSEQFTVTLSAPTGGAAIGTATATGTIQDDDTPAPPATVFINELHYDNAGEDVGEAIEIAGPAGANLAGWSVVLYNGNGGGTYGSPVALSGTIADQQNGYGTLSFAAAGLQNGAPDGLALVDAQGHVVQFLSYEGQMTATAGPAAGMTSTEIGASEEPAPGAGYSLQLTGAGATADDFTWQLVSDDSFGSVNADQAFYSPTGTGHIRVSNASAAEGDSGTTSLTFTVFRAGGVTNAASVDYSVVLDGTADSDDLAPGTLLSGTVSFAAGETQKQITVQVAGDVAPERNETLSVALGNAVGDVAIDDAVGTGTIVNDDPIALSIGEIQGEGHQSEFVGQIVSTTGIVTAVDSTGFYLQSEIGDGNAATSDAIFVFTGTAPTVVVGNGVSVAGTVAEFAGDAAGLTLTELNASAVNVLSQVNALPSAIVIGTGGLLPPTEVLDDDGLTSFDPATDGLDFWESLEGMRVTVDAPLVVSNTNSFGETWVVASGGEGATGVNDRGGITISDGDYNPERIQIDDDSGVFAGFTPGYTVGDVLGSVTGVVNYSFDSYELIVTEAVTVTHDETLGDDDTELQGDRDHLSLATYNVENLDPGDNKYDLLAHDIVYSLGAPDIVALQEIQDANGAASGGSLSGQTAAQGLIDAIAAAGGPHYVYVEIAPATANSTGGEPGGNIRNGYLYNADRVDYVEGSAELITGSAYTGSRNPLAATWQFNGQTLTTIDVHFTSRGGSDPLMGANQPPVDAGDGARTAQAAGVLAYVNEALASDPSLNLAVLGDFNGFYFEDFQQQLTENGVLTNLNYHLSEEERYSYLFDGNAQQIDNILVTGGLLDGSSYDAVHINSQFTGTRPTDHDPQVTLLFLPGAPGNLALSNATVNENMLPGTVVGTLSAEDGAGETLSYTLVNDAGGRFVVDPNTGVITTNASFDHEATASFTITARVTDSTGLTSDRQFTIGVNDVNEAPGVSVVQHEVVIGLNDGAAQLLRGVIVDERDATGLVGGSFTLSVSGAGGAIELDPNSRFQVQGNTIVDTATGDTLATIAGLGTGSVTASNLAAGVSNDLLEDLLEAFTYRQVTSSPANGRNVTLQLSDGASDPGVGSTSATVTFDFNLVAGTSAGETLSGGNGSDLLLGREGDDRLVGRDGNDRLEGGAGSNVLEGGKGDDRYIVSDAGDRIVERNNEGTDSVEASVSFSIAGQYVEVLALTGTAAINGTGNSLANQLFGNSAANILNALAGDDLLDGGAGADELKGGAGDDRYIVDDAGDRVVELDNEGHDTVEASVSFSLIGQFVDDLVLTGTAAINGTGNGLANAITGNGAANVLNGGAGDDRLDGGAGLDLLVGGTGDDVLVVDNVGDRVVENALEGHDRVESSVSFSLAGIYVEDLTLTGSALNGTGNGLDNVLIGNGAANSLNGGAGDDRLDGGVGMDLLTGGTGNDVYIVDNVGDRVVERANEGLDRVESSVSFNLAGIYVEDLTLTGSAAINGRGNSLNNVMIGNAAANSLDGGDGIDQLHGGLGADLLRGGAGHDRFWFETALGGGNIDTIADFESGVDKIVLGSDVFGGSGPSKGIPAGAFVLGTAAQDEGDRIIYDPATGALYFDADGSESGAAVQFAMLSSHPVLTYKDFMLG